MLTVILGLIGALLGVSGGLMYQIFKNKAAQALLDNSKVKNELNTIDQQISGNQAKEQQLQQQAQQAQQNIQTQENQNVSQEDLLKFLNNKPNQSN